MSSAGSGVMSMESGENRSESMGTLGMKLLIVSLSMLFLASIVIYVIIRSRAAVWPPPGMPVVPNGAWITTAVLLISAVTMFAATSAIKKDAAGVFKVSIILTLLLGIMFLVGQGMVWSGLIKSGIGAGANMYTFAFFFMSGLHAAHVVGGIIYLSMVAGNGMRGKYTSTSYAPVKYCAMYWHFLDVAWIVLFSVLFIAS